MCAYSENHKGNSMLRTLHSETNFLETNFLDKLIQHTFQFIICKNIPHRLLDYQQKRNFPLTKASKIPKLTKLSAEKKLSFNKGFQNFCVKLCYRHYKKIQPSVVCVHLTLFSCELTIQTKII